MSHPEIDFSKIKQDISGQNIPENNWDDGAKPTRSKKILRYLVIFLIFFILVGSIKAALDDKNNQGIVGIWNQIKSLVTSQNKKLAGETDDRINILLLGIGGPGHDGPYLTDTIILASFQPKEKKVALISIPRDLVVPIPGYGWRRINSADAFGEAQKPGSGAEMAVKTISQTFELPIQYYIRVDFAGFTRFIDDLGQLKICVDNSFTDNLYPTADFKTQSISFTAGCQMMDGETALRFVRSRHGSNDEGSDFARSRRQQKVILAVKDKLLSVSTLGNPLMIKKLYNEYTDSVATNLEAWEIIRLAQLTGGINKEDIINQGLTEGPGGQLQTIIGEDGAYLLQPIGGNFGPIRQLVANIFNNQNTAADKTETKTPVNTVPKIKVTNDALPKIEIRNGTFVSGLAGQVQIELSAKGYQITTIGNAPLRDYEKNVIYDLSDGKYNEILAKLTAELKANVSPEVPTWLKNLTTNDIIIILGGQNN